MERKKIDDLFREGLERGREPFDETHWREMERMLDQRGGRGRWKRRKAVLVPLGIAAGTAAAVALLFTIIDGPLPADEHRGAEVDMGMASMDEGTGSGAPTAATESIRTAIPAEVRTDIRPDVRSGADPRSRTLSRVELARPEINPEPLRSRGPNLGRSNAAIPLGRANTVWSGDSEEDDTKLSSRSLGSLSILLAPDLTSVRGAGRSTLSQNMGILYTQPLGKRLSVSTGLLYARKKYHAPYGFYNPNDPPVFKHRPTDVHAICDVIDIPLLFNLHVMDLGKIRLNAAAGLSSYVMLKENYRFSYAETEGYGGYGKRDAVYEVHGQNNHWLGIADFSVSVERELSGRISLGLRPFVKVPLTGVGYGRTKLESRGVAVTMRLNFSLP